MSLSNTWIAVLPGSWSLYGHDHNQTKIKTTHKSAKLHTHSRRSKMTVRELIKSVAPLARHLKVSSGAVYKWIRVDRIPAHHLIKIAKYYGLDVLSLQPLTGSELNNKVTVVKKPRSVLKAALDVYVGVITVDKAVESTGATRKSIDSILRYWKDELPTLYTTLEQLDQGRINLETACTRLTVTKYTMHGIRSKYGYAPGPIQKKV